MFALSLVVAGFVQCAARPSTEPEVGRSHESPEPVRSAVSPLPSAMSLDASEPSPPASSSASPPPTGSVAPPVDTAGPSSPAPSAPPLYATPPLVEVLDPSLSNGTIPRLSRVLSKLTPDVAKCVAENGGLSARAGHVEVQFLVRSRGRAEGVEILKSKGISEQAETCVRLSLKNRPIGAPSSDPVGVTVKFALKQSKK